MQQIDDSTPITHAALCLQMLMTRAMREKLKVGSKPAAYKKSVVRVRLPEGLLLQGCFNAGEPVAGIFDWVTDCLADPGTSYELASSATAIDAAACCGVAVLTG